MCTIPHNHIDSNGVNAEINLQDRIDPTWIRTYSSRLSGFRNSNGNHSQVHLQLYLKTMINSVERYTRSPRLGKVRNAHCRPVLCIIRGSLGDIRDAHSEYDQANMEAVRKLVQRRFEKFPLRELREPLDTVSGQIQRLT